jgi:hypothetical protein
MRSLALQPDSAWTEDRATQRCDPSADPGAKTDGAAGRRPVLPVPSTAIAPKLGVMIGEVLAEGKASSE